MAAHVGDTAMSAFGPMSEDPELEPIDHAMGKRLCRLKGMRTVGDLTALGVRCDVGAAVPNTDWQAAVAQIVQAHAGRIAATSVRGLTATFSLRFADVAHTERAVRCGLALLDQAPKAAAISIGVHCGASSAEPDALPLASSLAQAAAHLAQTAPQGRLNISQDAAVQVATLFEIEPMVPLEVPGFTKPLHTALLRRVDRQAPQCSAGADQEAPAAMVGRESVLADVQAAFRRVRQLPQSSAVTLFAEPGIGKSRLLHEFDRWTQAQAVAFHVLRGRATAEAQGQPFGLLGSLLRSFCQIAIGSEAQASRVQFEAVVAPWFMPSDGADLAQGHAHVLGHLIGIDFADSRHVSSQVDRPQQLHQLASNAAARWLRQLSAEGRVPVLLQIEDLHWADSESLDLLDHLLEVNRDVALLVVATSRPDIAARRPAWARSAGVHTRLDLGPLTPQAGRHVAAELLKGFGGGSRDVPSALLDRVVDPAQGNPFCIEERIRLLIDQGVIQTRVGGWTVSMAKLRKARLPNSLAGVLSARLKLLPAAERRTLQQASVIGPVFLQGALQALGADAVQAMGGLTRRDMALAPADVGAAGLGDGSAVQFSFKHQLLQQLSYDSLPKLTRRALHGKLARWLLALTGPQAGELHTVTAHHFEQAGDAALAAAQHTRAAEHAASRFARDALQVHAQRGLALLDTLPANPEHRDLRWRLLRARLAMVESDGQRDQHLADLDALATLAEASNDDVRRAQAWSRRCQFLLLAADYAGMKAAAREGMACAARAGDDALRLAAMRMLALAHLYLVDSDAGVRLAQQCLLQARALGLVSIEANCLNTLGMIEQVRDDPVGRLRCHEQELPLWRRLGDRRSEVLTLANIGGAWLAMGELVHSRRHCEEALRLARAMGNRFIECGALCSLSKLERWLGNGPQAVLLAQTAWLAASAVGMPNWQSLALKRLGDAQWLVGDLEAAGLSFEREQALAGEQQLAPQADSEAGLARVALARGDLPAAMRHVQYMLERPAVSDFVTRAESPRRVDLVCHLVLASAGDPRAETWLRRAHGELRSMAATIADAGLRDGFLNNIPDHRAILAAWALHEQELAAVPGSLAHSLPH